MIDIGTQLITFGLTFVILVLLPHENTHVLLFIIYVIIINYMLLLIILIILIININYI